ncbi:MAG: tetratricopeptide repeat protein [Elusimicrobia bacterium]|nr:tetratricopeptide repeat protein [Elusimicrobiota bacterium]
MKKILLVIAGIFAALFILEAGLRIGGSVILFMQERRNLRSLREKGAYRILCLGESTTEGGYPLYLEQLLNRRNPGKNFSSIIKATPGNTLMILDRLEANLDRYEPDIVVTMMGINDPEFMYSYNNSIKIGQGEKYRVGALRIYKLFRLIRLHLYTSVKKSRTAAKTGKPGFHANKKPGDPAVSNNRSAEGSRGLTGPEYVSHIDAVNDYYGKLKSVEKSAENDPEAEKLERSLKQDMELNPENKEAYINLGRLYKDTGRYKEAEKCYEQVLELDPGNEYAFREMAMLFYASKDYDKSKKYLMRVLEINPEDTGSQDLLLLISKTEAEWYDICDTAANYRRARDIILERNKKMLCVQYPMLNIEPLKDIVGEHEGVYFVDNETSFKEAVEKAGYWQIFKDNFAGEFGHMTKRGKMLLASNVADVIEKDIIKTGNKNRP